jgi:hypothetical protein
MRHTHFHNPFHRIEYWTGTYFRDAALWEAGLYLSLDHHTAPAKCQNLICQQNILEVFQKQRDILDKQASPIVGTPRDQPNPDATDPETEADRDVAALKILDLLLQQRDTPGAVGNVNEGNILEEEDDAGIEGAEADINDVDAGASGFVNYLPSGLSSPDMANTTPLAPGRDALNNQYVRVIHTNGVHHIALVSCSCRGKENVLKDMIYARMIPTSFERIRTIFTASVLDYFRYSNLETRSTAYHFFQMLRRMTMPMSPSKVVNFYHELRRLSRLWRWTKKLKWSGYGQKPGQTIKPGAGELAIFCPACPQPGINLPDNWLADSNRWAYRRFLVADGNFKADHVRQKNAADDIWLSDGTGMTTRHSEYKAFLLTAVERKTVCLILLCGCG